MNNSNPNPTAVERRWTTGSYVTVTLALLYILYYLAYSLYTTTFPTDGWLVSGNLDDPPQVLFIQNFLAQDSAIHEGDQLLAINGRSLQQILDAGHAFYRVQPPDWPDGTILKYTLQRGKYEIVQVDVPVQRISFLEYFRLYSYAGINNYVQLAASFFLFLVSLFVFLLRPGSRAAQALLALGSSSLPIIFINNSTAPTFFYRTPPVSIPFDGWTIGILPSLMYLALVFPYPKAFIARRPWLWIPLLYLAWPVAFNTAYLLNLDNPKGYIQAAFTIYPIEIAVAMVVTVTSFIHTARKVQDPVGRSQFKWMLAGISSFLFIGIGGWLVSSYLFPETMIEGNWLITTIGWFLLPVCMAIGITRYRLFDIDVIIRKTLVYALLTGLLGLVYFGGVAVLQGLLTADSGRQTGVGGRPSAIVVVLTTLTIAAIFNPLRRRLQDFIDRRFYRQKYDAEKALAQFATVTRSETSLPTLTGSLVEVVQETMQPAQVGLWLKSSKGMEKM